MLIHKKVQCLILTVVMVTVAQGSLQSQDKATTIKGFVLDSACAFIKNLKKPVSSDCAVACAKGGSPLVILADDGTIYWPISNAMPATGQNQRLMKFAGQSVTASGKVFEKSGSKAIVIEKIEAAPTGK